MSLFVFGISHHTASLSLRESWCFQGQALSCALADLRDQCVGEAIILSTCNRTEIYTTEVHQTALLAALTTQLGDALIESAYQYVGEAALTHMIRVATGLDSLAMGEPHVLGQMKQAYQVASEQCMTSPTLQHWMPRVFSAAKQIRSHTGLGQQGFSLAHRVLNLVRAHQQTTPLAVLLLGSGDMAESVAAALSKQPVPGCAVIVLGRNVDTVTSMATRYGVTGRPWAELPQALAQADVVICATSASAYVIDPSHQPRLATARDVLMIDLGLPRNIDPALGACDGISLYNLDDLDAQSQVSQAHSAAIRATADEQVAQQVTRCLHKMQIHAAKDLICQFRAGAMTICEARLSEAKAQLAAGHAPEAVLTQFAKQLSQHLLHQPTVALRQAACYPDDEVRRLLQSLAE